MWSQGNSIERCSVRRPVIPYIDASYSSDEMVKYGYAELNYLRDQAESQLILRPMLASLFS
jgi:hypothetical protein